MIEWHRGDWVEVSFMSCVERGIVVENVPPRVSPFMGRRTRKHFVKVRLLIAGEHRDFWYQSHEVTRVGEAPQ